MKAAALLPNSAAQPHSAATTTAARWGFAEFFVVSQTLIPALLYLPGTQPFRLYIRVASFAISPAIAFEVAAAPFALRVAAFTTARTGPRGSRS